ncbi:MAG: ACP S-malonyltransferase [Thermoanaerobaculia bacterium]
MSGEPLESKPLRAFLFPGQGSQKLGMGKAWVEEFPAARAVFEEVSAVLGFDIATLCWDGPEAELQLTANTQPAILTASVAVARVLAAEGHLPGAVAGHSLGEYSALVVAGVLTLADAARLVRRRGELMQKAVPVGVGAMAAILGLEASIVAEVAASATSADGAEICSVANYNSPEQTVLAGHRSAVERAMVLAKERGAKRALPLPVSAPFHCALMRPAREALAPMLAETPFADALVPVVVNIDARPVREGAALRDALLRQIDGPVRWVESVRWLHDELGFRAFTEVGPGSVLTALVKRIIPGTDTISIAEPASLASLSGNPASAGAEQGG